MAFFDGLKQSLGIQQGFAPPQRIERQPLDLNIGGFSPYGADTFEGPSKGSAGFESEPMDFDFNAPAKKNAAYQEEEVTPIQAMPVQPAQTMPELKAAPAVESQPEQKRLTSDELLRLAGMPTKGEQAKQQSDARTQEQLYKIGGLSYKNPEQQGIDSLEQARRYQEIANDPRTKWTIEGQFARQAFDKIMKSSGGFLQQAAKDEQAQAAAQAEAAKQAEDARRWGLDFGLKQKGEERAAALHPGSVEAQALANRKAATEAKVAEQTEEEKIRAEKLRNEDILTGNADKKAMINLRERQFKETQKMNDEQIKNKYGDDYASVVKDFNAELDSGFSKILEMEKANMGAAGKDGFLSQLNPEQVAAQSSAERERVFKGAVSNALAIAKAKGIPEDQIAPLIAAKIMPKLSAMPPSTAQRVLNGISALSKPVREVIGTFKGATNVSTGG